MLQGGEQGPGDCVAGVAEHLPDRALFDDPALFEHHHAVADITDHRHLVGDQDHRQAQALVDVLEQAEDRFGGFRVQRRGGFVAQQYFRVVYQRTGDAHTLLLATGQLRRVGTVLVLQANQLQQFAHLAQAQGLADACDFQWQFHVLPHGLGRHQVEVLEDHADASA
ncbi:hypothetical protein D3C86_1492400 [compost metagenome]